MFERLKRILAGPPVKEPERQTMIVSGGTDENPYKRSTLFGPEADRIKAVQRWRQIYKRGRPVSEGIDSYPLFCLSPGWQLVCNKGNEGQKDRVQEWLDQPHIDFDGIMWQGILDALICGTAFQEIISTRGSDIWGIIPRDASSFRIKYDQYGRITGYEQILMKLQGVESVIPIDMDRLLTITLFPIPGEMYGASLIGRAEDDIMRDLDIIESLSKAMHRHGTPKQQWDIGTPENPANEVELKKIARSIEDIHAKTDFVTANTKINMQTDTQTTVQKNAQKNTTKNTEKKTESKLEMFWAKIFTTKQDFVLAVCDEELIEKELKMRTESHGKKNFLKVKISKNFYGGMLVNEAVVVKLMNKATIGNLMGIRSVNLAEKNGFILRENIILIDEVLTPDSSRFWPRDGYKPGSGQPSFDKQFVRDYLETLDWNKTAPGPELPGDIVEKTSQKYLEAYQRLTGKELNI
jgi:hypothetical protein